MPTTSLLRIKDLAQLAEEWTRQMMDEFAATGRRPGMPPFLSAEKRVLAIKAQSNALHLGMGLVELCNQLNPGEFIALHLFCDLNAEAMELLRKTSRTLTEKTGAEVIWICGLEDFGDRLPKAGVHLQIMARTFEPPEVGSPFLLRHMRAVAERELLLEQGFRLLRIDLGASVTGGLERLELTISQMKTAKTAPGGRPQLSWLPWNMPPVIPV